MPANSSMKFQPGPRRLAAKAVAVFARTPSPGNAKTRLIPLLGAPGAAELQASLILDTLKKVTRLRGNFTCYLFATGPRSSLLPFDSLSHRSRQRQHGLRRERIRVSVVRQQGADLGERLERAFLSLLRRHSQVVVIGTDSPLLPPSHLRLAFRELQVLDAVLGPCPDGGFYLIGLRRLSKGLFGDVRWGSSFAFRDALRNIVGRGLACSILPPVEDVDRPPDLKRLEARLRHSQPARRLAPITWRYLRDLGRAGGMRGDPPGSERDQQRRL